MESQIEIYQGSDGQTQIEVKFEGETFWLSLLQISELFQRDKSVISRHIKNIYKEGELDRMSTVAKNAIVQFEGKRKIEREVEFYNLDLILSVGYRVNSKQGTQFRIWATQRLKDFTVVLLLQKLDHSICSGCCFRRSTISEKLVISVLNRNRQ